MDWGYYIGLNFFSLWERFFLIPLFLVVTKVCVKVRGHLEEGTGTSRKEILVYFLERDTRVEVDMLFLNSRFLLDEHRHELPEQLTHGVHALLTSLHIVKSMSHGEEHRLHSSGVRCGVQLRIALGNIRDGN